MNTQSQKQILHSTLSLDITSTLQKSDYPLHHYIKFTSTTVLCCRQQIS